MQVRLLAGGVLLALGVFATPALGQDRLVHQEVDGHTNAIIRVFKTTAGGRIDVEAAGLQITKSIAGSQVVTTIKADQDQLTMVSDVRSFTVSSPSARVAARHDDGVSLEKARVLIANSSAARKAAALIGNLGFGSGTPIQPVLLTTRAFIEIAAGRSTESSHASLSRWAREARQRLASKPLVIKASLQMTPSQCWDAYAREAIAAWAEYEDCMNQVRWYDPFGRTACTVVYDMRAIGAFSWWLNCVSIN
jgi:hypothetical protein